MTDSTVETKLKAFFLLIVLAVLVVNCTAVSTNEQNPFPTLSVTPVPTIATWVTYSDESLAEAMMLAYPDDGSVDYIIAGEKFFPDGMEITFAFEDIPPDSIASLTTAGWDDITSPTGTFRAFVACDYEHCQPRLFVENLTNSQLFEITFSMRMPGRPLGELAWIDNDILAFSQFSNPHYGFRYAIDANQRKHLLTLVLADECFRAGNCGS